MANGPFFLLPIYCSTAIVVMIGSERGRGKWRAPFPFVASYPRPRRLAPRLPAMIDGAAVAPRGGGAVVRGVLAWRVDPSGGRGVRRIQTRPAAGPTTQLWLSRFCVACRCLRSVSTGIG